MVAVPCSGPRRLSVVSKEHSGERTSGNEQHDHRAHAIQRVRRLPAAGGVGGGSAGDADSTPGATRGVSDVNAAAGAEGRSTGDNGALQLPQYRAPSGSSLPQLGQISVLVTFAAVPATG